MIGRRTDDLDYRLAYLPILWDVGGCVAKRIDLPPLPKSGEQAVTIEPLSDEAQLRGVHSTNTSGGNGDPYCRACGTSWPCLVIRVLNVSEARIDLERNRADEAEKGRRSIRRTAEVATARAIAAEAEVARLRAVYDAVEAYGANNDLSHDETGEGPHDRRRCRTCRLADAFGAATLAAPPDQPTHRRGSEG